jgi:hypothetical protein
MQGTVGEFRALRLKVEAVQRRPQPSQRVFSWEAPRTGSSDRPGGWLNSNKGTKSDIGFAQALLYQGITPS